MAIKNIQLDTTETTIIQSDASSTTALLGMIFCNTDSVSHTITVYAYSSSGSVGDGSTIIKSLSIPALDSYIWGSGEKFILSPSDKVSGIADVASKITVTPTYMTI